jgi:hypothetical protein
LYAADVWRNGQKVLVFGGVSTYGGFDQAALSLQAGANVLAFKQVTSAQGFFSVKFADAAGAALTDVRYVIDTCGFETEAVQTPVAQRSVRPAFAVRATGSQIVFSVSSAGSHQVDIITARGQLVRTLRGQGVREYRLPMREIGAGFYVVRVRDAARKRVVEKLMVW